MKHPSALFVSCCLAACATTEPRLIGHDDQLEQEAQRNESLAKIAEQSHSPEAARVYREKAAESRAAKKVQPSIPDQLATSAFDSLFDALVNGLTRGAKK